MMTFQTKIDQYQFNSNDKLFFDANIWLFLYGPNKPNNPKVSLYSQSFASIIAAKCTIFIDVLILSEFINSIARTRWKLDAPHIQNFKTYRKTAGFQSTAKDIATDAKRILTSCSRIESGFEQTLIQDILDEYALGDSDYNDQILTSLCKRENLILVTDDGDFKNKGISILSDNKKLLGPTS